MIQPGVPKFIEDMAELGFDLHVEAGLVILQITPVDGVYAGRQVETGVEATELKRWPHVPPHWIHLPQSVSFTRTNAEPSAKSDWLKHSRQLNGWGDAPPGVCWSSHLRAVLSEAIA